MLMGCGVLVTAVPFTRFRDSVTSLARDGQRRTMGGLVARIATYYCVRQFVGRGTQNSFPLQVRRGSVQSNVTRSQE